jgi:hypothetical protein
LSLIGAKAPAITLTNVMVMIPSRILTSPKFAEMKMRKEEEWARLCIRKALRDVVVRISARSRSEGRHLFAVMHSTASSMAYRSQPGGEARLRPRESGLRRCNGSPQLSTTELLSSHSRTSTRLASGKAHEEPQPIRPTRRWGDDHRDDHPHHHRSRHPRRLGLCPTSCPLGQRSVIQTRGMPWQPACSAFTNDEERPTGCLLNHPTQLGRFAQRRRLASQGSHGSRHPS